MNYNIIIDTNVLVSGLISPFGNPAMIIRLVVSKMVKVILDIRVFHEYQIVLNRPRFQFSPDDVQALLSFLKTEGIWIIPPPVFISLPDPSDLPFIELSYHTNAPIITGNTKHFPDNSIIMTPSEFIDKIRSSTSNSKV
ncbi:PIN domain protein [anaerobic digester metagenome]